jgi:protein gp37
MNAAWIDDIQAQCAEQNVAFFFKQWGGPNKKAAGRRYRGRTWDDFPVGTQAAPIA